MISPDAFWGIVAMLAVAVVGGVFGYGRLSQKVDSTTKSIDALNKKLDTFTCPEHSGVCAKADSVKENLEDHLRTHQWDGQNRRTDSRV